MNLREQQAKAWRLAPDDADHIAQDGDGVFWWYDYKPEVGKCGWEASIDLETKEDGLLRVQINGWDWRDTLQSKEEWEAMNKQDEKWLPEVGQECQYTCGEDENCKWITCEFVGKLSSGSHVVFINGYYKSYHPLQIRYRPIQTKADKYRDEQIISISAILLEHDAVSTDDADYLSLRLLDEGVRVLALDEFVAKRLTDEQVAELKKLIYNSGLPLSAVIDAVQNAIFGGDK